MKIGLGQIDMGFETKEEAKKIVSVLLKEAEEKQTDLVVFPEMSLTGFTLAPETYGESLADSDTLRFFQEKAKAHHTAICFGMPVYENGTATNHSVIVDAEGAVAADYTKIHPFSYGAEAKHYKGGEALSFCTIKGVTVAPLVCYDLRFPELFQIASQKAEVITVIANWPCSRREHWMSLLKARAIENQCYIVGVNRSGEGGGLSYCGDSMLITPMGEVLTHLVDVTYLAAEEIDPKEVSSLRESFPLKADRKPELYYSLYKNTDKR